MHLTDDDQWVYHRIKTFHGFEGKSRLGVAVSGGSDSVALLHLMVAFVRDSGRSLHAATVNHNLRKEAAEEAAYVGELCAGLGVPHTVLDWTGWDGAGNVMGAARDARYALLAAWAQKNAIETVALGHTLNDQAETFLMRLARAAGVDGLSAMKQTFTRADGQFCRPMLTLEREQLRVVLTRHNIAWCDDPTNVDPTFDRSKARVVLKHLAPLGVTADVLAGVAHNMTRTRNTLRHYTTLEGRRLFKMERGDLVADRKGFASCPPEIAQRLLKAAFGWIAGGGYPPRSDAVSDVYSDILACRTCTLGGCLIISANSQIRITREYNAVKDITCPTTDLWDGRWSLDGPHESALIVGTLGENGLSQVEDWRNSGVPRRSLLASPAIWCGTNLISAPLAGFSNGWRAILTPDRADFAQFIESH